MGDLTKIFNPKSIAVIGATNKKGSIGRKILENLLAAPDRHIYPVTLRKKTVLDVPAYRHIADIPGKIDVVIIATPARTVPPLVEECGKAGVEGVIIVSSGFREVGPEGQRLEEKILDLHRRYRLRIIGPNCLGIIRPHIGLNTTPLASNPVPGNIAFISQSGAFGRALVDWGIDTNLGFSIFASLGLMIDVDLGDLIDFLGYDARTKSIMVYMEEGIGDVKKFISAARGFARNKPIVVLKPARMSDDRTVYHTHTAKLATSDRVYDAVFRRVGVVRVKAAGDLFNIAGVLYSKHLPKGPRLLVMTNAAGVGAMAVNTLIEMNGRVAKLSERSMERLTSIMPPFWRKGSLLDLLRDAGAARYCEAIKICLEDEGVDGALVIYTPQGVTRSDELACALAAMANEASKPIITTWMGGKEAQEGRKIFFQNNVPTYDTPEEAVKTYLYMYSYQRNLDLLYETPADVPVDLAPPKNNLKALIRRALASGRTLLTEEESKRFLTNYRIPTIRTHVAASVEQAVNAARAEGFPLVLKVISPDVHHKSDVGGVVLGISSEEELRNEYHKMMNRIKEHCPAATITGVTVQKMIEDIDYEIILGAKKDEDFGAVILFGMGGIGVQIFRDFSIGLPPLNQALARRLMEETRVYRLLQGYRGKPPADLQKLEQIILNFSNLIADFPEIAEMDINPIALSGGKAYALDARIMLDHTITDGSSAHPHLVITPYPTKYAVTWRLPDNTDVLLRPIRPEDEPLEHEMLTSLSEESLRERFFQTIKNITHEMHVRFCNIDYDREMAIVAEIKQGDRRRIIGIARLIVEPDLKRGEFAVVVHDDFHGKGLGYKLIDTLIGIAQEKGLEECYGFVLSENRKMLGLCKKLGCASELMPDGITRVSLP